MKMRSRKKARGLPRSRAPKPTNLLTFKRTRYTGNFIFSNATTSGFWQYKVYTPSSAVNNFAELANVFDEYKIRAIKVTYRPRWDSVTAGDATSATPQPMGYAHVCVDPGSTMVPTGTYSQANLNTFLENSGVRSYPLTKEFSIYYKPKVNDQVFGGGSASRVVTPGWIKTTETGVDFRGFHIFLQQNNMSISGQYILDEYVTVYLQCKNLR